MQLPVINYLFSNEITNALFYTLIHSLWQGLLLALVAGIILMFTKRAGPALRYNLFCGLLLVFVACNLITFYYEISLADKSNLFTLNNIISSVTNTIPESLNVAKHQINIIEKAIAFIKSNENIIVLAWFLIIALKCIYLLTGLKQIYILKHRHIFNAGEFWIKRLAELSERIGVRKTVILVHSEIAKIPMVIGHFKPVILFPAALFIALPQEEIEAILLHELAHIRRKDYLVNMLQHIIGMMFFFNPAVLWISSLIKDERENCCDDIAINEVKNKKQFIHALVSFQEYNINAPKYAASFPGNKNHLLNRIKRIITNNNKTLNNMEKIFLTSGLIITGFLMASFSYTTQLHFTQKETIVLPAKNNIPIKQKDTVPTMNDNESKSMITTSFEGKQYKIVEINGKITELYVDNEKIPGDKISQYRSTIDKIQQQVKEQMDKKTAQMNLQQKELLKKQTELMKQKELLMKDQMGKQDTQMKLQQKELLTKADLMKQKELMIKDQMQLQQKVLMEKQIALIKQNESIMKLQMDQENKQARNLQKLSIEKQIELIKQRESIMKLQMDKQDEQMEIKNKEMNQIQHLKMRDSINQFKPTAPKSLFKPMEPDLINKDVVINIQKENRINNVEILTFKLENEQRVVNNFRMAEQLSQKLKNN